MSASILTVGLRPPSRLLQYKCDVRPIIKAGRQLSCLSSTYFSLILAIKCYLASILYNWRLIHGYKMIHCKKRLAIFPSSASMSLTKLSMAGYNLIDYSRPGRVWLVTSRLGTGKSLTYFYSVSTSIVRYSAPLISILKPPS